MEPGCFRELSALRCVCGYELYKQLGLQSFPRWRISNCKKIRAEVQVTVVIRSPGWIESPQLSPEGSPPRVVQLNILKVPWDLVKEQGICVPRV